MKVMDYFGINTVNKILTCLYFKYQFMSSFDSCKNIYEKSLIIIKFRQILYSIKYRAKTKSRSNIFSLFIFTISSESKSGVFSKESEISIT